MKKSIQLLITCLLLVTTMITNMQAQSFIENWTAPLANNGFAQINFQTCNSPSLDSYRLLRDTVAGFHATSIWNPTALDLSVGFTSSFRIRYTADSGDNHSDGIAFVLQDVGTAALGQGGGYMGFSSASPPAGAIVNSLAVEFDINRNGTLGDPNGNNHTAVVYNGNQATPAGYGEFNGLSIEDGNWHDVQIVWDPCSPVFTVTVDTFINLIQMNVDIVDTVFNGNPTGVFWGFTAGKASEASDHDICIRPISIHPPCCETGLCQEDTDLTACAEEGDFGFIALECDATFAWTFPLGSTAILFTSPGQSIVVNASEGIYTVVITYPDGCTEEIEYEIVEDCCVSDDCPPPTNLGCQISPFGELQILWDPVPGAVDYAIYFTSGSTANCPCEDPGQSFLPIYTGGSTVWNVPQGMGKCFSWYVVTRCLNGESGPSAEFCHNETTECPIVGAGAENGAIIPNSAGQKNTNVFPNPSSNEINIEFNLEKSFDTSISVFNAAGKQVAEIYKNQIPAGKFIWKWDISDQIEDGLYIIKIKQENGISEQHKVVIQR